MLCGKVQSNCSVCGLKLPLNKSFIHTNWNLLLNCPSGDIQLKIVLTAQKVNMFVQMSQK